ncbi:MAG: hypothetical protein IT329_02550 [Caldilineaceae bacterium]|nr:hypothetical protein [Caldilineaceae bacterium]
MYRFNWGRAAAGGILRYRRWSALGLALLLWLVTAQPGRAQSGNAWQIDYYANPAWGGAPVYTDFDNVIAYHWRSAAPGPRMPADNWTARMTSDAFFYAGLYRFTLLADDEFVLNVDGMDYLDTRDQGQSGKAFVFDIVMTQGVHPIRLDYRQFTGQAYISLDWRVLKGEVQTPPGTVAAGSVATRYGDFTRCMQQGLHQSHCFQAGGSWGTPSLRQIRVEAPIALWEVCTASAVRTLALAPDAAPRSAQCSRTEAGWFAR